MGMGNALPLNLRLLSKRFGRKSYAGPIASFTKNDAQISSTPVACKYKGPVVAFSKPTTSFIWASHLRNLMSAGLR